MAKLNQKQLDALHADPPLAAPPGRIPLPVFREWSPVGATPAVRFVADVDFSGRVCSFAFETPPSAEGFNATLAARAAYALGIKAVAESARWDEGVD